MFRTLSDSEDLQSSNKEKQKADALVVDEAINGEYRDDYPDENYVNEYFVCNLNKNGCYL